MKKNKDLQKDVQENFKWGSSLNVAEPDVKAKFGRYLKNFIYLISLAGIGLLFNACMAGYVATEPSYVEISRPPRPSNVHVWIDGDWTWNRQTQVYVQKTGYWEKPNQGRSYVSGYWQASPRGKYWVKGRWQKKSR